VQILPVLSTNLDAIQAIVSKKDLPNINPTIGSFIVFIEN
jgi:hypothetical protein